MTTNLGNRRCIENTGHLADDEEPNMSETEARAIMHTIFFTGATLLRHNNHDSADPRKVCMTRFTDPATDETRFAVETWNGATKTTYDYADYETALFYTEDNASRLGLE